MIPIEISVVRANQVNLHEENTSVRHPVNEERKDGLTRDDIAEGVNQLPPSESPLHLNDPVLDSIVYLLSELVLLLKFELHPVIIEVLQRGDFALVKFLLSKMVEILILFKVVKKLLLGFIVSSLVKEQYF